MKLLRKVPPIFWIVLLAFVLRIWGVTFGIGFAYFHTDEPVYARYAKTLLPSFREDIKPRHDFPSPYFYTLAVATKVGLLANDQFHFIETSQEVRDKLPIIAGRLVSILASTGTVLLIYLIGKHIIGTHFGLIAASFLAVTFLDIQIAHYLKHDPFCQFFGWLAILLSLRYYKTAKLRFLWLAALAIFISASTKEYGYAFVFPLITATLLRQRRKSWKKCLGPLLSLTFSLATLGYYLLFVQRYFEVASVATPLKTQVCSSNADGIPTPIWWLTYLASVGLFYPQFLTTLGGGVLLLKKKITVELLIILSLAATYTPYLLLQRHHYDRWFTPLTPVAALLSGLFFRHLWQNSRRRLALFLVTLAIGTSLIRGGLLDYYTSRPDTRQQAVPWIASNLPPQAVLVTVGSTMPTGGKLRPYGFENVTKMATLDGVQLSEIAPDFVLIASSDLNVAVNYRHHPKYQKIYTDYQDLLSRSTLRKEFKVPLFEAGFFAPHFLEHGATVGGYHNPTLMLLKLN